MHYDWVRFLVPRHGAVGLDSAEFLRDPSDLLGNPDLKTLSDLAHLPMAVILGEPGMGKSTLLREAEALAKADGRAPISIALDQLSDEERLYRRLTSPKILGAGVSAPPADLLIDSLDTGQLFIHTLGDLLAEAFREYPKTADLRIRLTCRSTA